MTLVSLLGAGRVVRAEDVHDGEDSAPSSLSLDFGGEEGANGESAGAGSPSAVVLRPGKSGPNLRDASGKLLPPPNFQAAAMAFRKTIDEARNPAPSPVAVVKKPTPRVEIDELPTYTGSAPNPKIGFIGADLKPEPLHPAEEVAVAEAAGAEKQLQAASNGATGSQIRNAIEGKVSGQPLPDEEIHLSITQEKQENEEKKRKRLEAERLARVGRMPASFTKPKLGATP